jgi:hypothetical protein
MMKSLSLLILLLMVVTDTYTALGHSTAITDTTTIADEKDNQEPPPLVRDLCDAVRLRGNPAGTSPRPD